MRMIDVQTLLISLSFITFCTAGPISVLRFVNHLRSHIPLSIPAIHLECRVVSSPVLNDLPWLQLHHVVLLRDTSHVTSDMCAIDFTPDNQTSPAVLKSLLMGKRVPATLRVQWFEQDPRECPVEWLDRVHEYINNHFIDSLPEEKALLMRSKDISEEAGRGCIKLMNHRDPVINNPHLRSTIDKLTNEWQPLEMNLYNRNCQHFSLYIYDLMLRQKKQ